MIDPQSVVSHLFNSLTKRVKFQDCPSFLLWISPVVMHPYWEDAMLLFCN